MAGGYSSFTSYDAVFFGDGPSRRVGKGWIKPHDAMQTDIGNGQYNHAVVLVVETPRVRSWYGVLRAHHYGKYLHDGKKYDRGRERE